MARSPYVEQLRRSFGQGVILFPSVSALVFDRARVLLVHLPDGRWSLPGGMIDPGESAAAAVAREVHEETGVVTRPVSIIGVFGPTDGFRRRYANGDEVEFVDVLFRCEVVVNSLSASYDEIVDAAWFEAEAASRLSWAFPIALSTLLSQPVASAIFSWDDLWLPGKGDGPAPHDPSVLG